MNHFFRHFFYMHSTQFSVLIFATVFFITWNLENVAGVIFDYKKWKHAFQNAPFILTNIPAQVLMGWAFAKTIVWTESHHFGFLCHMLLSGNAFLFFLGSFIFLDFGEYVYHFSCTNLIYYGLKIHRLKYN